MEPLKNGRHELFIQGLLSGLSQERAYVAAGYRDKGAATHASRLARNGQVAARLAYLQQLATEKVVAEVALDRAEVIRRLDRNAETAFEAGAFSASNQALVAIGKTLGLFAEQNKQVAKEEVALTGKHPSEMSLEELQHAAGLLPE